MEPRSNEVPRDWENAKLQRGLVYRGLFSYILLFLRWLICIIPRQVQVHSVSSKCVKQVAPPSSDSKVLAVQSWDGVPRKNPVEPP